MPEKMLKEKEMSLVEKKRVEEQQLLDLMSVITRLRYKYGGRKASRQDAVPEAKDKQQERDVVKDALYAVNILKKENKAPFGAFVKKYKLSDKEAIIVLILLDDFFSGGETSRGYDLALIVSFGHSFDLVKNLELLAPYSKLGKNFIICPKYFNISENIGSLSFFLTDRALNEITGHKEKAPKSNTGKNSDPEEVLKYKSPKELYTELDKLVIGQEEAKRALATGVYNHYTRINDKTGKAAKMDKSNILLIGPTGSGKTMLCKTLATLLGVPMVVCDVTTFTEKGYVGGDVEDALSRLYRAAGKDIKRAEKGIVYLDELDKISAMNVAGQHNTNRDVSGKSVQEELLKLLEANIIHPVQRMPGGETFPPMNTKNILFIAGGAFDGLEEMIAEEKKAPIGFCAEENETPEDKAAPKITSEDVINYGFMPELIGRLHVLAVLKRLTVDDLLAIIKNAENGLLLQFQMQFSLNGIKLEIEEEVLRFVATEALAKGSGARGLRSVMEEILQDTMFQTFGNPSAPKEIVFSMKQLKTGVGGQGSGVRESEEQKAS